MTQTAEALHQALSMPEAERQRRRVALAQAAAALPPTAWLQAQLDALDAVADPAGPVSPALVRWTSGRLARLRHRAR